MKKTIFYKAMSLLVFFVSCKQEIQTKNVNKTVSLEKPKRKKINFSDEEALGLIKKIIIKQVYEPFEIIKFKRIDFNAIRRAERNYENLKFYKIIYSGRNNKGNTLKREIIVSTDGYEVYVYIRSKLYGIFAQEKNHEDSSYFSDEASNCNYFSLNEIEIKGDFKALGCDITDGEIIMVRTDLLNGRKRYYGRIKNGQFNIPNVEPGEYIVKCSLFLDYNNLKTFLNIDAYYEKYSKKPYNSMISDLETANWDLFLSNKKTIPNAFGNNIAFNNNEVEKLRSHILNKEIPNRLVTDLNITYDDFSNASTYFLILVVNERCPSPNTNNDSFYHNNLGELKIVRSSGICF